MSTLSNRRDLMEYDCFSEMMEEMREIHKMIQKLTSQKCHHLTVEQAKLIFLIAHQQMNQKEIAQKLRITEATLSVRIKRLVDMGLIERKLNEDDKRHYYIVLSSQGEAVIDEMKKDFHHVHQIVCKGMTDEDYMAVLNVVKKIKRNLKVEIK